MAAQPGKRDTWMLLLYLMLLVAGLVLLSLGVLEVARRESALLLGLGVLAVSLPAGLYPIAHALQQRTPPAGAADPDVLPALKSIAERLLISDAAKRVAYREQDRNALRQAIREDMARGDYDAALVLVDKMALDYGYREEAEQFRAEITAARKAETDVKIEQAVANLNATIEKRDWDAALAEAARVVRLFPDSPRVAELGEMVRGSRQRYKEDLERRFLQAAERDEIDVAMELLKELDKYLTGGEAAPLREVARGVIVKKRENLGVQFKLAVHDKEWLLAVRIGEQIIRDFPNTRMADEVRGMIDLLRQRAAGQQAVAAIPTPQAAPPAPAASTPPAQS